MSSPLESPARVSSPRWPIGSTGAIGLTLALILAHFAVIAGVGGTLSRLFGLEREAFYAAPPAAFVVIVVTGAAEAALVFGLGMAGFARLGFREVGWRAAAARDVVLGVMGLAACGAAIIGIAAAFGGGLGEAVDGITEAIASFTAQQRALFVLIGIAAAFAEETIFRGVLQPTLQRKLGRGAGLVVTAMVFAAYHVNFRPAALLGKLAIGLVLGGLRDRTGTLWAPAVAHGLVWAVLGIA